MKIRIQVLKRIVFAVGIVLLTAGGAQAQLVYQTDFSGTYTQSIDPIILGGDDAALDIGTEIFFGSPDNNGGDNENLTLTFATANRHRASGVWLDTTGWAAGLVTVEVEVSNFIAPGADKLMIFQAYAANGVNTENSVSVDLHSGFNAGTQLGFAGTRETIGTATIAALGEEQAIDASGTVQFTFEYNGTDQFIALTFAQRLRNGADLDLTGTADLDDLTVTVGGDAGPDVLLGDVNLDTTVNFLDISPFISVLSNGTNQDEADCNEDGGVDFLDISPFIAILAGA